MRLYVPNRALIGISWGPWALRSSSVNQLDAFAALGCNPRPLTSVLRFIDFLWQLEQSNGPQSPNLARQSTHDKATSVRERRIDVGKATLDVYLLERDRMFSVPNEEHAIAALIRQLSRYRLERIVIEATGRLEQPFVRAAVAKGLPVVVVSPLKVRRFAGAIGQLAKTDEIDARLIARFASTLKPVPHPTPDAKAQLIKDLVVRRRSSLPFAPWRRTAARSCLRTSLPASIGSSHCSTTSSPGCSN